MKKIILSLLLFIMMCTTVLGQSILSCDKLDYFTNDIELGGKKAWSCTVSLGTSVSHIMGRVNKEQLVDEGSGISATHDFLISFTPNSQKCRYPAKIETSTYNYPLVMFKYYIDDFGKWSYQINEQELQTAIQSCEQRATQFSQGQGIKFAGEKDWEYVPFARPIGFQSWGVCIYQAFVADYALLQEPLTIFSYNIAVESKKTGQRIERTITNSPGEGIGDRVVSFDIGGDKKGRARWEGGLSTTFRCPSPRTILNVIVAFEPSANKWYLISDSIYEEYRLQINLLERDIIRAVEDGTGFFSQMSGIPASSFVSFVAPIFDDINYYTDPQIGAIFRNPETIEFAGIVSSSVSYGDKAQFDLDLQPPISVMNPIINLKLDAEWIGIQELTGKPQIVSIEKGTIQQGQTSTIKIIVRNEGRYRSSFTARLDGCTYTRLLGEVIYVLGIFEPGESKEIYLPVSCDSDKDVTETCTLTVYDNNDPSIRTQATLTSDCKARFVPCSPRGSKRCSIDLNYVESCGSDGRWVSEKHCEFGCLGKGECSTIEQFCARFPHDPRCSIKCESCWGWLMGKIFSKARCMPRPVFEYKIFGLITVARMSQSKFCPYFFLGILTFFGMIAYLIAMNWEKILSLYGGLRK